MAKVTQEASQASPSVRELEALLLGAKLTVPDLHPGSVSRSRLIGAAQASGCRVVGVTAPAGYGKSTLLAQWAASRPENPKSPPIGWRSRRPYSAAVIGKAIELVMVPSSLWRAYSGVTRS